MTVDPRTSANGFALLSALLACSLATRSASAEDRVVLNSDEVLIGTIAQEIELDHVTIKLHSGEVREIPWDQIASLKREKTTRSGFDPELMVGLRIAWLTGSGQFLATTTTVYDTTHVVGGGPATQLDVGVHLSPSWSAYGCWEHGFLSKGTEFTDAEAPASNFAGVGLLSNSNPRGPIGLFFEVGIGYRWISAHDRYGLNVAGGVEPLRVGLGIATTPFAHFQLDAGVSASAGLFSRFALSRGCVGYTTSCDEIRDDKRTLHVFETLFIGARYDL